MRATKVKKEPSRRSRPPARLTRIPRITRREMAPPTAQPIYDAIAESRGAVRGPFEVLLHRPAIADGAQRIGAYLRFSSLLSATVRESAILTVARLWDCAFEWSVHEPIAIGAGVRPPDLEAIRELRLDELDGDVGLAARFARELIQTHGVGPELFERARLIWSVEELVELASLVAYYTFLAVVLNAFDVRS